MKIADLHKLYTQHCLVDTDTRRIRKNTIFFALKGNNFNGNKFAKEALIKGAKFAIVDELEFKTSENIILVDDVLRTLQELASFHRDFLDIPIISLTGSNGKTTTKELINSVLSSKYNTRATVGNLNNHIGVPLTLLSMNSETEIGIIEMGANHAKEIAFLSNMVKPNFGYITNFGSAHLEGFGSLDGVIKAKSELYTFLIRNKKLIFVNPSDTIQLEKTEKADIVLFEESILFIEVNPFVKLSFKSVEIQSNLIGSYNFSNISAAITIGNHFNISEENIKEAIENYIPSNNRSEIIKTKRNTIILDAYNANPTSMKAALDSFKMYKGAHKTVILGDMFELGDFSADEHQKTVDLVAKLEFDNLILVGENFNKTITKYKKFKTFLELEKYLLDEPLQESTIFIKGSRSMALERVVELC
ncbi:UDP-N-acetylmuramoyl-tripeptide--D-alanyl-D-alanine ligase [Tenacibaculum sp. Bg11-29]|uniref:UDP-N-acetylmuramoyl-tripeptide--D-alanyl-D- alanine ligase n=1 Tax=Tenacibaculum sp. Bg11-29 TaxID=2058306 RepID=UPI000C331E74|nr:UDP-N-acetylmuramoyl-tripeptide--D-alanyl-D-alanine ligase [Tenacibaculum sp. Bg11-29]PKH50445.1 UDP-N-acetylmuramoyl-tripeptide--D-alanyl-D-alanine ligase [Tenacibaculum sp. Bg11-29]